MKKEELNLKFSVYWGEIRFYGKGKFFDDYFEVAGYKFSYDDIYDASSDKVVTGKVLTPEFLADTPYTSNVWLNTYEYTSGVLQVEGDELVIYNNFKRYSFTLDHVISIVDRFAIKVNAWTVKDLLLSLTQDIVFIESDHFKGRGSLSYSKHKFHFTIENDYGNYFTLDFKRSDVKEIVDGNTIYLEV